MAANRDIGIVSVDVTYRTGELTEQIKAELGKRDFQVSLDPRFPTKRDLQASLDAKVGNGLKVFVDLNMPGRAEMQAQLDTKSGKGLKLKVAGLDLPAKAAIQEDLARRAGKLKLFIDELDLPGKKEVQAQLDQKVGKNGTGLKLFIDELDMPGRKEMQAQLDSKSGKDGANGLKLFIDELDMPGKQELQAQLDGASGKDGANGLKLFIDELGMPGFREIQAQLDTAAKRHAANGLKLFIDELALPLKPEMQGQLDTRVGKGLKLRVIVDTTGSKFLTSVRQSVEGVQKAITDIEEREQLKRETNLQNHLGRALGQSLAYYSQGEQDRETLEARGNKAIEVRRERAVSRNAEIDRQAAQIAERIELTKNLRLEVQDNAFRNRRILNAEQEQRRLARLTEKPLIQRILVNTDQVVSALADFDRTMTRVLRTSLFAFTAWSAGVTAAVGAASIAGVAAFASLEQAATRAATVAAADEYNEAILKTGEGITNFAEVTEKARKRIIDASSAVALDTLFSPKEVTEGTKALLQSGLNIEEALEGIGPAARFAQVTQIELEEATRGLSAGLASAGLQASDSGLLLDQFAFVAENALGEAGDYMEAFANRAAASAKSFGYTNEEALTLLALLGQTGTLGREAGTQANIVFRELARGAGRASEAWRKYGIDPNGTLNDQLFQIGRLTKDVLGKEGRAGVAGLAEELGLTYRSISSILQVLPQAEEMGQVQLDNFTKGIGKASGTIGRSSDELRKNISFQFQNLLETFGLAFVAFGEAAAEQVTDLFDAFAGPGGLIAQATPKIREFGAAFGRLIGRLAEFVQTDAFKRGIATLVEAIRVTIGGVRDAFQVFSAAFGEADEAQSTFESVADAILAFSRVSATVLPVVAEILGKIFDALIDHADAFEFFAKAALTVYALRKAFTLFLKPIGKVIEALAKARLAMIAMSAAGTVGPVSSALIAIATRFGLITTAATTATAAVTGFSVASGAAAVAGTGGVTALAAGRAALGPLSREQGRGLFGAAQIRDRLRQGRLEGVAELERSRALPLMQGANRGRTVASPFGGLAGRSDAELARLQFGQREIRSGGIFGSNQTGARLRSQRLAGVDLLETTQRSRVSEFGDQRRAAAFARVAADLKPAAAPAGKFAEAMAKIGGAITKVAPQLARFGPTVTKVGGALARFAGPIGLAILAVEALVGVFKGFFEEVTRGSGGTSEFGRTMQELAPVFEFLKDAALLIGRALMGVLGLVGAVAKTIGRVLGGFVRDILTNFGDVVRGIKLLFSGDLIGALKAFGDVVINTITLPFRLAIGGIIDLVADAIGSVRWVDKYVRGTPIKDMEASIRGAAESTRDFRLNMSQAQDAADGAAAATRAVAQESTSAASAFLTASSEGATATEAQVARSEAAFGRLAVAAQAQGLIVKQGFNIAPFVAETEVAVGDLRSAIGGFVVDSDLMAQAARTQTTEMTNAYLAQQFGAINAAAAAQRNAAAVREGRAATQSLTDAIGGFQARIDHVGPAAAQAWGEARLAAYANEAAVQRNRAAFLNVAAQARASIGDVVNRLDVTAARAKTASDKVGGIRGGFLSFEAQAATTISNTIAALANLGTAAERARDRIREARSEALVEAGFANNIGTIDAGASPSEIAEALNAQGTLAGLANEPGFLAMQRRAAAVRAERERRRQLIAAARRGEQDAKILADAGFGPDPVPTPTPTGGSAPRIEAVQREFVDPDVGVQAALDRLKPAAKIAEVNKLVAAATSEHARAAELARSSTDKLAGAQDSQAGAAILSRRQTLLLAESLPTLDKAIEKQRAAVTELDNALNDLRNTQLLGTKAYSDAAFENEQAIKRLQLARLDALAAGQSEGSAPVIEIDKQIKDLQLQAERASLVQSLELDPLKRKLDETFQPVREDTFTNIVTQFQALTAQHTEQQAQLTQREAVQARLNEQLQASQAHYEKIDAAAQRSVEAFNKQSSAAADAANKIAEQASATRSSATQATAGAAAVNDYSSAVENVPSGKGVVDKSLKGINERVTALAPQFQGAGRNVQTFFTQGMNRTFTDVTQPALNRHVQAVGVYLDVAKIYATRAGRGVMTGFLAGMKEKFGSPQDVGSVAWYLNVFIPQWIRDHKGPVSYDATILVPAGEAVMQGFHRGLRSGFSEIQGFVKEVGPSLSEYISDDAFSGLTATVMADIAVGRTPDIEGVMGHLRESIAAAGMVGGYDPDLAFLHQTLSLKDTTQQAFAIVKALGGGLNTGGSGQLYRPYDTDSAHSQGTAADIGTGGAQPTPASLELFAKAKKMLGSIFRQIIHNGQGLNAGGGSFKDSNHFDHVHLEWLKGKGFDLHSGKIGTPPVIDIPGASDRVDAAINAASKRHGVELALLAAVAKQESGFDPRAGSHAGAQGLFQFMPATARGFGIDPWNIEQAADGGARFLKNLLKQFGGRYDLALGGYNAGPYAPGLSEGRLPPYAETRNYVRMVTMYLEQFRKKFGGFREHGGPVQPGKAYVVGERRPEIFVPNTPGRIIPRPTMTSGGGPVIHDNRTINVTTAATDADAVGAMVDAHTRTSLAGVNLR